MGRRKGNKIAGRFVVVEHRVLTSFARLEVSHAAIVAYLLMKKSYWPEKHGERVMFTYPEARAFMSTRTYSKALKELLAKGFLVKVEAGGLRSGRPGRAATLYELIHDHMKHGRQ